MSDWQVGDLALCVEDAEDCVFTLEGSSPQAPGPIVGLTYTVAGVRAAFDCFGRPGVALSFVEIAQRHPRSCGYNAELFQKATAPEADEFDREVIDEMNRQPIFMSQAERTALLDGCL